MAGEVVVDALPYFDQGYDETGVRDAVRKYYKCTHSVFVPISVSGYVIVFQFFIKNYLRSKHVLLQVPKY